MYLWSSIYKAAVLKQESLNKHWFFPIHAYKMKMYTAPQFIMQKYTTFKLYKWEQLFSMHDYYIYLNSNTCEKHEYK